MQHLAQQRCHHHLAREAVARCPECARFFCRECITEHDDRVICATCLKKITGASGGRKQRLRGVMTLAYALFGFLFLWMFFYCIGQGLLSMPSSFHEGTLWKKIQDEP